MFRPKYTRRSSNLWLPAKTGTGLWRFLPVGNCCVSCGGCIGDHPNQIQVDISGVVDDNCADCDTEVNGSYVTDFLQEVGNSCTWQYTSDDAPCGATLVTVTVWVWAGGEVWAWYSLAGGLVSYYIAWELQTFEDRDCMHFSNFDVPYAEHGTPGPKCDPTSSTCSITTL